MPELPEVETVRRGLEPAMLGARIEKVELRRADPTIVRGAFERLYQLVLGETRPEDLYTWREQIVCPVYKLVPVPDGLDDPAVAASYITPLTHGH